MKVTVSEITKKGKLNLVSFKNSIYMLHVPCEAGLKINEKIDIEIIIDETELPKKSRIQLFAQVIRCFEDYCLASAGGLMCKIPSGYILDQSIYIVIR